MSVPGGGQTPRRNTRKNEYQARLAELESQVTKLEAQERGAQDALDRAAARLAAIDQTINDESAASADRSRARNSRADVVAEVNRNQANVTNIQAQVRGARGDLSTARDLAGKDDELSPQEIDAWEKIDQKRKNSAAGRGWYTDAEAETREKAARTEERVVKAQEETTAVRREGLGVQREGQATTRRGQDIQAEIARENRASQERQAEVLAELKRGELGLREAEVRLQEIFNERRIALENLGREAEAARHIDQMGVTQRAQDISLQQIGSEQGLGVMGILANAMKYVKKGDVSEEDLINAFELMNGLINKNSRDIRNEHPRVAPHPTTEATARGENRAGGADEEVYTSKERQEERRRKAEAKDSTLVEAVELAWEDQFTQWVAAKKAAGDASPNSMEAFVTHLKETGQTIPSEGEGAITPEAYVKMQQSAAAKMEPNPTGQQGESSTSDRPPPFQAPASPETVPVQTQPGAGPQEMASRMMSDEDLNRPLPELTDEQLARAPEAAAHVFNKLQNPWSGTDEWNRRPDVVVPRALQAPVPYSNGVPTDQTQAQPAQQQPGSTNQPIIINVGSGGQAPQQPVQDPTGVSETIQKQANESIKQTYQQHAATDQVIRMLQEQGFSEPTIARIAQERGYDPTMENPFNDYLNQKVEFAAQQPMTMGNMFGMEL